MPYYNVYVYMYVCMYVRMYVCVYVFRALQEFQPSSVTLVPPSSTSRPPLYTSPQPFALYPTGRRFI